MARKAGNNTSNGGGASPKKKAAVKSSNSSGGKSRATKAPKRIRRKCSAPNCNNRVVQGGVCVTHGAKRKLCSHPGCTKAVKLAGACSTHGPARKKCDTEGCTRVAVQGGKCLSHGARRKICNYPCVGGKKPCERNAIMGGMCKKHYDHVQNAESMLEMSYCVPVRSESMANKKDDSSSSGESDEEVVKSFPSPAWTGAAPEFAGSSSTTAMANTAPPPMGTNYHHPGYVQAPSYYAPETAYGQSYGMSSSSYRQPKKIATRPGHQRGLSIFDEMNTVNAIIGTSGTEHPTTAHYPHHHPPPQYQQQVSSYHHSQAQAAAATAVRMPSMSNTSKSTGFKRQNSLNTKTPATQVSFADGTRKPSNGEKPCTGDASCTCDACRSPTLAIFEQMIQASQRIDSGDIDTDKYSGLSAPKLSPRKTAKEEKKAEEEKNSAVEVKVGPKSPSPKNVSFMEEEPTSSGSVVVRKVSNNNMEGQSSTTTQYADHQGQESRQDSPKRGEGPASHALVAMAIRDSEAESGSRTVSYDVDDSRQRRQYYSQHPPPPQPGVHYGHHPQHHPPPQHHYYQYPPHHGHAPPAYGHPPPHHHHYAPPAYHHQAPPHYAHSAPAAHYQPPQTPSLYDKSSQGPQERDSSSAAVVSSHSAHQDQQLLPKRREDIDHLFIPKEV